MTENELKSMTVIQLKKLARQNRITLGAGIDKAGIVQKILNALPEDGSGVQMTFPELEESSDSESGFAEDTPAEGVQTAEIPDSGVQNAAFSAGSAPMTEKSTARVTDRNNPAGSAPVSAEPRFQAAWHNNDSPLHAPKPSLPTPPPYANRASWHATTPSGRQLTAEQMYAQPHRPIGSTPRFGPAPSAPQPAFQRTEQPASPGSGAPAGSGFGPMSPLPEKRFSRLGESGFGPRAAASPAGTAYASSSAGAGYSAAPSAGTPFEAPSAGAPFAPAPSGEPAFAEAPAVGGSYTPSDFKPAEPFSPVSAQDTGMNAPTLEELLASGDYEEGGGVLELHPDGYGFLRAPSYLPSSRDIYVSMAQIRRFGLRTGDMISGKIRPQREGDKYAALLYISTVNGVPEEESFSRPHFDELTPVYPSRRISLESTEPRANMDMRLVDLIAPLGFGQRALILAPPDTGKREIMTQYARVISDNYPDVSVLMLLIDVTPEDATIIRDSVPCPVLASSFDQAPEAHLRLSEIVLERAMRLVEQQKDVVLLVDSLTRLAKIYTTAAAQQGRSLPGMVNPASLFRAKRLFGAARACKEGGSLTVIAAMDVQTGSKVDDSVVEEFKGTANMELTLDQAVAKAGVHPAVNLERTYTKNSDILLTDSQKEGLNMIRSMLNAVPSAVAIPQLMSMMEKADTNAELLMKIKDWMALMNM